VEGFQNTGIEVQSVCVASIANWDFFFESRKAQFIVKFMGRNGARIFYGLLGGAIFSLGFLALIGAINL